jgi:hypothetical protein
MSAAGTPAAANPAATPEPPAEKPEEDEAVAELSKTTSVFFTLGSLVVAGVAASAWVLYFTDWFPLFLSLLTLGGLFAWISFVAGMLTKERKENLQHRFEEKFLAKRKAGIGVLVVTAVLLLGLTALGSTVIIETYGDSEHRVVDLVPLNTDSPLKSFLAQRRSLKPHHSHKLYIWHLGAACSFVMNVSHLPSHHLELDWIKRKTVIVPDDLARRPVVLIRPTFALSQYAETLRPNSPSALYLNVKRNGELVIDREPFRGKAVWLGAGADMPVPPEMEARWKDELSRYGEAKLWLPARGRREFLLCPDDKLLVELVQKGREGEEHKPFGEPRPHTVGEDHLIEEVTLDLPRKRVADPGSDNYQLGGNGSGARGSDLRHRPAGDDGEYRLVQW